MEGGKWKFSVPKGMLNLESQAHLEVITTLFSKCAASTTSPRTLKYVAGVNRPGRSRADVPVFAEQSCVEHG